jgi:hypothetical protein
VRPKYLSFLDSFGTEARQSHKHGTAQFRDDGRRKQSRGALEAREYLIDHFEGSSVAVQSLVAIPIDVYRNKHKADAAHKIHYPRKAS